MIGDLQNMCCVQRETLQITYVHTVRGWMVHMFNGFKMIGPATASATHHNCLPTRQRHHDKAWLPPKTNRAQHRHQRHNRNAVDVPRHPVPKMRRRQRLRGSWIRNPSHITRVDQWQYARLRVQVHRPVAIGT